MSIFFQGGLKSNVSRLSGILIITDTSSPWLFHIILYNAKFGIKLGDHNKSLRPIFKEVVLILKSPLNLHFGAISIGSTAFMYVMYNKHWNGSISFSFRANGMVILSCAYSGVGNTTGFTGTTFPFVATFSFNCLNVVFVKLYNVYSIKNENVCGHSLFLAVT